ncbi:MAG: sugar phosphate isomerase/epimerase [Actinomycetota bacterium]|nr:sugar phosphate isomerase/epimerase [Actinomycetota bacterium]
MINLGIFTGYYPYSLSETIARIKKDGFTCVQLDPLFKDVDLTPGTITKDKAATVRRAFRDADLPIASISGYTNIIHPDLDERARRLDALKELLRFARDFGSPYVISETGTFNTESDWVSDPRNKTEEGYETAIGVIEELAQVAYDHGSYFVVENYTQNVIGSVQEVQRMLDDVRHPGLRFMCDPTNYYDGSNIDKVDETLDEMFDAFGTQFVIAHAKDIERAEDQGEKHAGIEGTTDANNFRGAGAVGLPAAGLGILNYELYLTRLIAVQPNIPLMIEHLDESDIPRAKQFLTDVLNKVGG